MATIYSDNFNQSPANSAIYESITPVPSRPGEVIGFRASITALPVTGDKWRFIKVPDGARFLSVEWTNTDMGTDVPGTLGLESTDPDSLDADIDWEDAQTQAATAAELTADAAADGEDYLTATIGTVSSGVSGTATVTGTYFVPAPVV